MPHSLRAYLSKARYEGHITDEQYKKYIRTLDRYKALENERVKSELKVELNELEPCEDADPYQTDMESDEIKILQKRSYLEGFHEALKMSVKQQPCEDAISRADRLVDLANAIESDDSGYWTNKRISSALRKLPPVTQKSGKWDRLYSWLNDMRLGIAPDETVTDIDERNCRESQTDILDEIMEWMVKAESEDKE